MNAELTTGTHVRYFTPWGYRHGDVLIQNELGQVVITTARGGEVRRWPEDVTPVTIVGHALPYADCAGCDHLR